MSDVSPALILVPRRRTDGGRNSPDGEAETHRTDDICPREPAGAALLQTLMNTCRGACDVTGPMGALRWRATPES